MTNYTIWADRGVGDTDIYKVKEYLQKCAGGSVKVLGIGPSVGQNYGLHSGTGTVGVFMTNGVGIATPNDFELGCKPGGYYHYDRCIFVWPQWIGNQWMSDENIKTHVIKGEWDWNRSAAYNIGGQTAAQWFSKAKYVDLVAGTSPEDVANRICRGAYITSAGNTGQSTTSGSSSTSGTVDNTSPLLKGEMTFEELVGEVCNGIDLMFLCKRSTVVVTDFSTIFAEAKYLRDNHYSAVSAEDIKLWQLEEDSYELNINQHGFYNTVYVEYEKGIVKETFDDFVRVFGEVPITYKDPKVDKTTAIMKAKAYLAAHVRDFELQTNATILTEPDIDIGDIVTLDNPQVMQNQIKRGMDLDSEYLFVKGVNTSWEGDSMIQSDLELQFSPTSPAKKEVPTAGISSGSTTTDEGVTDEILGDEGSYDDVGYDDSSSSGNSGSTYEERVQQNYQKRAKENQKAKTNAKIQSNYQKRAKENQSVKSDPIKQVTNFITGLFK